MFLLDTNAVSKLYKVEDSRANADVVTWISNQISGRFFLSVLTFIELEIGVLRTE